MGSDGAPLKLETRESKIQTGIVEVLEELLARARAGDVESLMWFAESATSSGLTWGITASLDRDRLIGRISILQHSLLERYCEGTDV